MHRIIELVTDTPTGKVIRVIESPHIHSVFGIKFKAYVLTGESVLLHASSSARVNSETYDGVIEALERHYEANK